MSGRGDGDARQARIHAAIADLAATVVAGGDEEQEREEKFRERFPRMKTVLMSASANHGPDAETPPEHEFPPLDKPFSAEELGRKLLEVLGG